MYISTIGGTLDIPNVDARPPGSEDAVGLALDTVRLLPLNGMRYMPPEGGSGWYIWGGEERSEAADFFTAIQVKYLSDYVPNVLPLLALPAGFRFRIDKGGKQKVWFDGSLLEF